MSENTNVNADFWHGKTPNDIIADFKKKSGFSQGFEEINKATNAMRCLGQGLKAIANATSNVVGVLEGLNLPETMKQIELENKGGYLLDEVFDELMSVEAGN